jgi:hypothetical protein
MNLRSYMRAAWTMESMEEEKTLVKSPQKRMNTGVVAPRARPPKVPTNIMILSYLSANRNMLKMETPSYSCFSLTSFWFL